MANSLKPIDEQVIVITGASSGIGLATAELAAQRGARLVLAARSGQALAKIARRLQEEHDTEVVHVQCDVADREQVERVAKAAIDRFGRIDTWVNNAGIGMYGRLDDSNETDSRRLFDINFWGVFNGAMAALPHLRANPSGGALINVGSEVSEAAMPVLGMYTASKHAVKGLNDALRIELEEVDESPVSVTLIQPTAVDTPFPQHARNYLDKDAKLPTPTIEPRKVARAILSAATKPTRAKRVGVFSKLNTSMAKLAPALADRMAARQVDQLHYDDPARQPQGALFVASEMTGVVGQEHGARPPTGDGG